MQKFVSLLTCIAFCAMSSPAFADGLNSSYSASNISLNTLENQTNPQSSYPSCANTDYYWYQQQGSDKVSKVPIPNNGMVLEADKVIGLESATHYANGNVIAYQGDNTVRSNWLIYDQANQHAMAGDHFILTRQYDMIEGKWLDYYMDLDSGKIVDATILHNDGANMYATTSEADVLNKKQYQLENAYLTSCDPNQPSWHITASKASMDYINNQISTDNMRLYAESVPVVALPYFSFPMSQARTSGFLMPDLPSYQQNAEGTQEITMGLPYYWNMAPNYDMTIEPKIFTANGFLLADQFRYKTESGSGIMYTEQVPNDWVTGQYRYDYSFTDKHQIFESVTAGYDLNQVSDSNYFLDFGFFDNVANMINLPNDVYLRYTPDWGNAELKSQGYVTLNPTGSYATTQNIAVMPIYETLPQASVNVKPQPVADTGIDVDLKTQYSNFTSSTPLGSSVGYVSPLQSGQRSVFYPSFTYPMQNSWGYVKPKFGYDFTNYQLSPYQGIQDGYTSTNLGIPVTSLDSGMVFERPITLGNSSYAQTLEPRLYYLYVPNVDQSTLPVFDTAPATYNMNQLFSENRFSGFDRMNNSNSVTMGVNSKLINDNTGNEYANYGVGYRYNITPENQFLYGSYNNGPYPSALQELQAPLFLPEPDLIGEVSNHWTEKFTTMSSLQYSTIYQNVTSYSGQLMYNPEDYKVLNARFNYTYQLPLLYYAPGVSTTGLPNIQYENQYALDLSGQYPIIGNRWLLEGRANYDFTLNALLNFMGGIEYNGGCWALRAMAEQFIYNVNVNSGMQLFFQFELKGIGGLGPMDPTTDLKSNIPGYMPIGLNGMPNRQ